MLLLNASERQLLLVIWRAGRRNAGSTLEDLKRIGHLEIGTTFDWADAFHSLVANRLVYIDAGHYLLTPEGTSRSEWEHAQRPFWAYTYDAYFARAALSRAHSAFCRRVYGRDLCQHGMADMAQLDHLIDVLAINAQSRVLELGCGNGMTAEYISDRTGAQVTGIDISDVGIQQAQKRTREKRHRLTFCAAHVQEFSFPSAVFDTAILIDVLYFVDADKTLDRIVSVLQPGAQMGIFYTQWQREGDPLEMLEPERTNLAGLLQERNLEYSTSDLSSAEEAHWRKKVHVLNQMQEQFEAEDNAWLYIFRLGEAEGHINLGERRSRYLYHVRLPVK